MIWVSPHPRPALASASREGARRLQNAPPSAQLQTEQRVCCEAGHHPLPVSSGTALGLTPSSRTTPHTHRGPETPGIVAPQQHPGQATQWKQRDRKPPTGQTPESGNTAGLPGHTTEIKHRGDHRLGGEKTFTNSHSLDEKIEAEVVSDLSKSRISNSLLGFFF